jgi:hypothetical protein
MTLEEIERRLQIAEGQIKALRQQIHDHEEYIDTVTSPLWKRLIWWCQGYYLRKVGRWY